MHEDKVGTCEWQFPCGAQGPILRPCQNSPDRTYHITTICPGPTASQEGLRFRKMATEEAYRRTCFLRKIKAQFGGENVLSVHV